MEKIEQIILFDENGNGVWIADLVRCKDCIHDCKIRDDWFCADGERKG